MFMLRTLRIGIALTTRLALRDELSRTLTVTASDG